MRPHRSRLTPGGIVAALLAAACAAASAQDAARAAVQRDREEFASWLRTSPVSPRRAVAVLAIGRGLSLGGPDGDVAIAGIARHRIEDRDGRVRLIAPDGTRPVRRGVPLPLGTVRLIVAGLSGRSTLTVFGAELRGGKEPVWFDDDPRLVFAVELSPPASPGTQRVLAPEGVEVEAREAGTVSVAIGGGRRTLRVMRLPGESDDESELEIYFRDATNDRGTYPSGRFVALTPAGNGRYRLDFNRARNPFCAYNTAYPCPAPWRGNLISEPIRAGERYAGGGLEAPKPPPRAP